MKNIIVIKSQDRGGSFFIKNDLLPSLKGRQNFIYDINNEYTMFENVIKKIYKELPDMDVFLQTLPIGSESYVNIVFEEATGFFSRSGSQDNLLLRHITRRFHTKNVNVFIFHSLLMIPKEIMAYVDFIVLFRTSDDKYEVYKKFKAYPKIIEAFNDVQHKTEGTLFNRDTKKYYDEKSKRFFHYKRIIAKD